MHWFLLYAIMIKQYIYNIYIIFLKDNKKIGHKKKNIVTKDSPFVVSTRVDQ